MKTTTSSSPSRKKERILMSTQQDHMEYWDLMSRLNKTLYYGTGPKMDRPSLALTGIAVNKFTLYDHLFPSLENLHMEKASRLSREACISPCSLVLAMVYIDRLGITNPNFLASVPSSKLFIVSVMVASKFLHDEGEEDEVFNDEWANSVNVDLAELNQLEREFLQAIDWRLLVDQQEFMEALTEIEKQIAIKESSKRGWLSYTDLDILTGNSLLNATLDVLASRVVTVAIACSAAYIASLLTLVGSAAIVAQLPWNQKSLDVLNPSDFSTSSPIPIIGHQNSTQNNISESLGENIFGEDVGILNATDQDPARLSPYSFSFYPGDTGQDYRLNDISNFIPKHHVTRASQKHMKKMKFFFCGNLKIPSCAIAA